MENSISSYDTLSYMSSAYARNRVIGIATSSFELKNHLLGIWKPFLDRNYEGGIISNYRIQFYKTKEKEQILVLTICTNQYLYVSKLRDELFDIANGIASARSLPEITSIGRGWHPLTKNNTIFCNEFFIHDISYMLAPPLHYYYDLLGFISTKLFADLIPQSENNESLGKNAMQRVVPMQIILAYSFLESKESVLKFYRTFFTEWLESAYIENIDMVVWRQSYIDIMKSTFLSQKGVFLPYIESLVDDIVSQNDLGEEWLNEWRLNCSKIASEVQELQYAGAKLIYESDHKNYIDVFLQKAIGLINNQFYVDPNYELNLYNIIISCLDEIDG
jgi:hypothetical protein